MGRLARFIPVDSYFHILSRGNNRQKVFFNDADFTKFMRCLEDVKNKFNLIVVHYAIMFNHYHIILFNRISENLSLGIKYLNQSYSQYFRKKYSGIGYLWQDRYKSFVIQDGKYLLECGRYIELNPVKAGMVNMPEDYKWSSYNYYAFGKADSLLQPSIEYLGFSDNKEIRQEMYKAFVLEGMNEKRGIERYFRQGFCGSVVFEEKLKSQGLKEKGWKSGPNTKNN